MRSITKQEREDYLEAMYLIKRKGNQITKKDISEHLQVPISRVGLVVNELIDEGYLRKDENRHLFLTAIGINKGREFLERHRCLTEFLRLVSGVEMDLAEKNACAIEHILDEKIYLGIRLFMENRHTFSYTMKANDLNFLFPYGERKMPIAIYEKGSKLPRILSREYSMFEKKVVVDICEESYLYLCPVEQEQERLETLELYYLYHHTWKRAEKEKRGYGILTEAMECHLRRNDKLSEGKVSIALISAGAEQQEMEKNRVILTVSLI